MTVLRIVGVYPFSSRAEELRAMADQIDKDRYGVGAAAAALREYAEILDFGLPNEIIEAVPAQRAKRGEK